MSINMQPVSDDVFVTSQLTPEDIPELVRNGIRSVINNRPDGEGGAAQPSDAALRATAEENGLFYAHLPVVPNTFSASEVARMRALVGELPKPIIAFCRTGTRSRNLYNAAFGLGGDVATEACEAKHTRMNVGGLDRTLRMVAGAGLIGAAATGVLGPWAWLGVIPLATGVLRFCPAYLPFGLRTGR